MWTPVLGTGKQNTTRKAEVFRKVCVPWCLAKVRAQTCCSSAVLLHATVMQFVQDHSGFLVCSPSWCKMYLGNMVLLLNKPPGSVYKPGSVHLACCCSSGMSDYFGFFYPCP